METPKTPLSSILKLTPRNVTVRSTNFIDGLRPPRTGGAGGFGFNDTTGSLTGVETPDTNRLRPNRVTFFPKDHVRKFSRDSTFASSSRLSNISSSSRDTTLSETDVNSNVSHVSNSDDEGGAEAEDVLAIYNKICKENRWGWQDSPWSPSQNAEQAGLPTPEAFRNISGAGRFLEEGTGGGSPFNLDQGQGEVYATPDRMIELPQNPPAIPRRVGELSQRQQLPPETPKSSRTYQQKLIPRSKVKEFSFGKYGSGSLTTPKRTRDLVQEFLSAQQSGKNKSMTATANEGAKSSPSPLANRNGGRSVVVKGTVKKQLPSKDAANIPSTSRNSTNNGNLTNMDREMTPFLVKGNTDKGPSGKPSTPTAPRANSTKRTSKPSVTPETVPDTPIMKTPIQAEVIQKIPETAQEEDDVLGDWTPSFSAFPSTGLRSLLSRHFTPTTPKGTFGMGSALRRSISVDTMQTSDKLDRTTASSGMPRAHSTREINSPPLMTRASNSRGFPGDHARAMIIKPTEIILSSSEDEDEDPLGDDGSTFGDTKSYNEDEEEMAIDDPSVADICGSGISSPDFYEQSVHESDEENFPNTLDRSIIYSGSDAADGDDQFEASDQPISGSMINNTNGSQSLFSGTSPEEGEQSRFNIPGSLPHPPISTPTVLVNETMPSSSSSQTGRERVTVTPEASSAISRAPTMLYKEIKRKLENVPDKSDIYAYLDFKFSLVTELCKLTDNEWKKIEKKFEPYFGPVYIETVNNSRSNMRFRIDL